jgi:hypothetical protein
MNHNIFWFDISMNDTMINELNETSAYLLEIVNSLWLRKYFMFFECCS